MKIESKDKNLRNFTFSNLALIKNKTAFSMIEISVVLLIIAALMLAINQGSALIRKSKLAEARRLTNSSIVSKIEDLALWYESSMANAMLDSTKNNISEDSKQISYWNDISNSNFKNDASASGSPKYVENSINSLPAARFVAANSDRFTFNGSFLDSQYYTIFIVIKRSAATSAGASILGGSGSGLLISYGSNTTLNLQNASNTALLATINQYDNGENAQIFTFITSPSGKSIYVNGLKKTSDSNSVLFTSWGSSATIGSNVASNYFSGDIAEIIVYKRALNNQEISDVNTYLGKKFSIKIS